MSKFFVDIDNTITKTEYNNTDQEAAIGADVYAAAEPLMDRIEEVNILYDAGHDITYWTGRGTVSGIDYTELTKEQLDRWGAKYHHLLMGKPDYDYFIDDKSVNSEEWFRPLRVGLVLNNLIRDYLSRLIEVYVKYTTPKDATEPHMPIMPINPYLLEESFPLPEDDFDNVYAWLNHSVPLEVFGGANQTRTNILQRICLFQTKIHDKLILLTRETARSKYATLSFLAKNQFDLSEIIFVENYEEYWKHVDVVITDNPEILKVKPAGKTAVVLMNEFNKDYHSIGYGINSPDDIFKLPIFHRKPITKEEMLYISNEIPEGEVEDKLEGLEQNEVEGAKTVEFGEAAIKYVEGKPSVVDLTALRDFVNEQDAVKSDTE